jgi:putative tricarboxylic transport membrane protein
MYPKIDFFVGLFLIAISIIAHSIADKMPEAPQGLGAGDYPKLVLKVLIILGLIQVLYSGYLYWKKMKKMKKMKESEGDVPAEAVGKGKFDKGELKHVLILFVCVALYIRLVALFGFILLTPFFLFALMLIFGLRKWLKMGIISIVSTAILYVVFNNWLLVLLPRFNIY